jgi:hypothetical protein
MNDLIYRWNENSPVQMVANLSLPGGFKLDNFGSVNCDVITATGKQLFQLIFFAVCWQFQNCREI